jgi:hypothetical protein
MASIVEAGIAMLEDSGRTAAGAFLVRERVPFRVFVRVLAEPDQRRKPRQSRGRTNESALL